MQSKKAITRLIYLASTCLLVACSGGAQNSSAQPLRVGWTYWEGDYTLLVAEKMGYFDQHGVEVEPVLYEAYSKAIPDLVGGKIDGGLLSVSDLILSSTMMDVKCVYVYDSGGIASFVSSPDIQSLGDLKGKRIGIDFHSPGEMFVTYMLKSKGLDVREVKLVNVSPENVSQSIPDKIDAGYVFEPYTTQAIENGNIVLYESNEYSTLRPDVIVFRQAVTDQRPDDIRAFLLAWNEAVAYRRDHPEEALALIMEATGLTEEELSITGENLLYTLDDNVGLFADTQGTNPDSIYFTTNYYLNFLVEIGDITTPPDLNSLLDPSFLK